MPFLALSESGLWASGVHVTRPVMRFGVLRVFLDDAVRILLPIRGKGDAFRGPAAVVVILPQRELEACNEPEGNRGPG